MAARKGLGRGLKKDVGNGLDSLITPKNEKLLSAEEMIDVNKIEPNKNQPRVTFNEDKLIELAESIKVHGVVEPLLVTKKDGYYKIIAGERRWRAAKKIGLKKVPVIVRDYTDQEIMEIALIENIQREDLNPIEEAMAYQNLIEEYNLKQDELAERVAKSRTTITNSMRLLKLDKRVQDMLVDERISSGHARALLAIKDMDKQYDFALKVFDEKLSVREVEKLIKSLDKPEKKKKKPKELSNDFVYREFEEKLKQIMGTKVSINRKDEKSGKIEIEYYSNEDFERITDILKLKEN
ncbi:ParB/RepB/Spo0J family partition protein [Eubacterium xylanophilum]|uniref:ParB/RepB/Spo0J family partition protein n=1 Tax=Eubacterium xylanophilum TaxID=39497 RepID=UPI00047B1D9D|nr:ParB/RepB/Spo0J family partition protein [Eubacterium xylanophilum]